MKSRIGDYWDPDTFIRIGDRPFQCYGEKSITFKCNAPDCDWSGPDDGLRWPIHYQWYGRRAHWVCTHCYHRIGMELLL